MASGSELYCIAVKSNFRGYPMQLEVKVTVELSEDEYKELVALVGEERALAAVTKEAQYQAGSLSLRNIINRVSYQQLMQETMKTSPVKLGTKKKE
jgi:hypothetical protein